jgi:hypothetical protein
MEKKNSDMLYYYVLLVYYGNINTIMGRSGYLHKEYIMGIMANWESLLMGFNNGYMVLRFLM